MKTIEERAASAGILSQYMAEYPYDKRSVELGYVAGAYDQKDIDIDKAKNAFNKTCGWLSTFPWYNEVFEKFIKAMEE